MRPTPDPVAKPNPFFGTSRGVPAFVRRQFVSLMALTFGWAVLRGAEGDKKGKGGGGKGKGGGGGGDPYGAPVY